MNSLCRGQLIGAMEPKPLHGYLRIPADKCLRCHQPHSFRQARLRRHRNFWLSPQYVERRYLDGEWGHCWIRTGSQRPAGEGRYVHMRTRIPVRG